MPRPSPRSYRHGNLPAALIAAARGLLDDGGPQAVGLRETARRVGVSATAAYRHFESKDDLLAAVAAEGFRELGATLAEAASRPNGQSAMGRAYVDFAQRRRGAFRLMFGPILASRGQFPALQAAADALFAQLSGEGGEAAAFAAWGLAHGLACLIIDGVIPEARAQALVEAILAPPAAAATPGPAEG